MGGQNNHHRGGHRGGHRSHHSDAPVAAAPAPPTDPASILNDVASNPILQSAVVIIPDLVKQGLDRIETPAQRQYATTTFTEMLQGSGPTFGLLKGACCRCDRCEQLLALSPWLTSPAPACAMLRQLA